MSDSSYKMKLEHVQSQKTVMTPRLRQAIELLHYNTPELSAFIAEAVQENPLLEYTENTDDSRGDGTDNVTHATETDGFSHASNKQYEGRSRYDSEYDIFANLSSKPDLRGHLEPQINLTFTDTEELLIAYKLLDCLDGNGWLSDDWRDLPSLLGVGGDIIESVIVRLHGLEPAGIFARDLRECLRLQLVDLGLLSDEMEILLSNLDNLANYSDVRFCKETGLSSDCVGDLVRVIRSLNPKPASLFDSPMVHDITPDLLLSQDSGGEWRLELNSQAYPHVCINHRYHPSNPQGSFRFTVEDRRYISERYGSAKWLIKSIRQRSETILRVGTEIVKQQKGFFEYGISHMRPLVLRDIANATDLHESTISRVINGKYIVSERGVFELKYFFTVALPSHCGGSVVSAAAARERIRSMIDGEGCDGILSDSDIADILIGEGIDIARRTVAKYREAMGISSSVRRRKEKNSSLAHV